MHLIIGKMRWQLSSSIWKHIVSYVNDDIWTIQSLPGASYDLFSGLRAACAVVELTLHPCTIQTLTRFESFSVWSAGSATVKDDKQDISAITSCASLHTLKFICRELRDLSAFAGFPSLHTLDLSSCYGVRALSALAGCARLLGRKKGRFHFKRFSLYQSQRLSCVRHMWC